MPSLPTLDTEALRRELAGLADPLPREPGATEQKEIAELGSRLCCVLASLFSNSLERSTLWERIGTGLQTGLAKVSDDDCERLVSLCLEHVKAEPGLAAACEPLRQILETVGARPREWRFGFLDYLRSHSYVVLSRGRARWEQVKSKEIDL